MSSVRAVARCIVASILSVLVLPCSIASDEPRDRAASISVADLLSEDVTGFARVEGPRTFIFPDDHGPHPDFRSEWWYFTGNLQTLAGARFGFQLTFFRFALIPEKPQSESAWATNQIYMAHFALSDVGAGEFSSFERLSREALNLASATARPFRVWLDDWSAEQQGDAFVPMRLRASEGAVGIDLELGQGKPVVLQGKDGFSQKSAELGNASHYYSFTRMPVEGTVTVGDERHMVKGLAWMDREWSTSALAPEHVGWDWFALQLSDGSELMYYQLREQDGGPHPFSAGKLVDIEGTTHHITREDVNIEVLGQWVSPRDDAHYPSGWRLQIPRYGLDLVVVPHLENQEMNLSVRYWEGAVRVSGRRRARPVDGNGYVELTGYADGTTRVGR